MKVFHQISELVTLQGVHSKGGRNLLEQDLGLIQNASLVANEKEILWVGKSQDLPEIYQNFTKYDCSQYTVLPSWVDAHTHLIFAGNRSQEYSLRLNGASYEEIAQSGGGIVFTMMQTRDKNFDELFQLANERIEKIYRHGVATIEIKSGYGLSYESEELMTRVIHQCKKHWANKVTISNTFMAAHAKPKNFATTKAYMNEVVIPLLEKLAPEKIIDAVDIFHEKNYFTDEDTELLFKKAHTLGIRCKLHADELNDNFGASLGVKYKALSCDHLLKVSDQGIKDLSQSKTVAMLLPGTGFFLGKPQADARKLLDNGVKVAIASDFNPGSCHFDHVFKLAQFVAPTYKMNRAELIAAITLNASHALNLTNQGALIEGMMPKFSLFKAKNLSDLLYTWNEDLFFKHGSEILI
ncbi:MAG: imidazolonepropionase [Bacteriovoracaceae bacterium]